MARKKLPANATVQFSDEVQDDSASSLPSGLVNRNIRFQNSEEVQDPLAPVEILDPVQSEGGLKRLGRIAAEAFFPGTHRDVAANKTGYFDNPEAKGYHLPGAEERRKATKPAYEKELAEQQTRLAKAEASNPFMATLLRIGGMISPTRGSTAVKLSSKMGGKGGQMLGSGVHSAANAAIDTRNSGGTPGDTAQRSLQAFTLGTLAAALPGKGNLPVRMGVGAMGGAGLERVGRVLEGGKLTDDPKAMIAPATVGMMIPAFAAGGRKVREAVRGKPGEPPQTARQEATRDLEAGGGRLSYTGPKLPEGADKYGPRKASKLAQQTSKQILTENYEADVNARRAFNADMKNLGGRPEARMPLDEQKRIRLRNEIIRASRGTIDPDTGKTIPGTENPELRRFAKLLSKKRPLNQGGSVDHLNEQARQARATDKPIRGKRPENYNQDFTEEKTVYDVEAQTPLPARALKGQTVSSGRGERPKDYSEDFTEDPTIVDIPDGGPSVRTLINLRKRFDKLGKVGRDVQGAEKVKADQYRKLAGMLREEIGEIDPSGYGKTIKARAKAISGAEERNDKLGMSRKAEIRPDSKKRKKLAGWLATSRATDPQVESRRADLDDALQNASPEVKKRIKELNALIGYHTLRGETPQIPTSRSVGQGVQQGLRLIDRSLVYADPYVGAMQRQTQIPPAVMYITASPKRKKKEEGRD